MITFIVAALWNSWTSGSKKVVLGVYSSGFWHLVNAIFQCNAGLFYFIQIQFMHQLPWGKTSSLSWVCFYDNSTDWYGNKNNSTVQTITRSIPTSSSLKVLQFQNTGRTLPPKNAKICLECTRHFYNVLILVHYMLNSASILLFRCVSTF